MQDISIHDMTNGPSRFSDQAILLPVCASIEIHKIPVKSHVYETISLPVRHYDFKIKFLRNNHSNVRRINFSVKRIAESKVENAQNYVLGHFGRNRNCIFIFSSQLVTAKII